MKPPTSSSARLYQRRTGALASFARPSRGIAEAVEGVRAKSRPTRCSGQLAAITVCRPSDRRGSGSDPKPQYAFKVSMFNVSCNSH